MVSQRQTPIVLHVKTALREDDAQICVAPNLAWAALVEGRPVTMVFHASAVQSIAKGYGWTGWMNSGQTAMDRAALPDRERKSLAEQMGADESEAPHDYGDYLRVLKEKGVRLYYNRTMISLYNIKPEQIDEAVEPLDLRELLKVLTTDGNYLVY